MADTDVLTLDEARDALRFATGDTTRDDALVGAYVPAVTSVVEDVVGPVVRRTVTHTANGGEGSVLLPTAASSVTSVVEDGTTLTAGADYVSSLSAGIIYRGSSTGRTTFADGVGSVVVTYVAGLCDTTEDVPANIKLAARLILAATFLSDEHAFTLPVVLQGYVGDFGTAWGRSSGTRATPRVTSRAGDPSSARPATGRP